MPGPISGWERGGLRPIIRAHWRAGYLRTEAHLPENPLALPHAQPHPEAAPEVLGKIRAVPGVRAQAGIPRAPAQIRLQLAPLRCIERSGPTRSRAFPQRLQPALLEAMHPPLYGGVIFTEEHRYLAAGMPHGQKQQRVQSVIVAGLFAASDFLPDGDAHRVGIVDAELVHRVAYNPQSHFRASSTMRGAASPPYRSLISNRSLRPAA